MIKKFFTLLLAGLILVSGFQFGLPYYHYLVFQSDLEELSKMRSGQFRAGEMKSRVLNMARDYNVTLHEEDLTLTRERYYRIEATWKETVNWLGLYKKTFRFNVDTAN